MSIDVICNGCNRSYRVPEERAGTRARCKTCGIVLTIPTGTGSASNAAGAATAAVVPPPVAMRATATPPPIPMRAMPVAGSYASPVNQGNDLGNYPPIPPPSGGSTRTTLWIVVGIVAFLVMIGGGLFFIIEAQHPAIFLSDASLRGRLPGVWTMTRSVTPATTGTFVYLPDGTYHAHFIVNGRTVDYGGRYFVQSHYIIITQTMVNGQQSRAPRQVKFGPIRELSEKKLVLQTKYQKDESYQRTGP